MKYIRQLLMILLFSFVGEILNAMIPLPVPASIYGLVLLFFCLMTGIVRLEAVKDTARFLIDIMPLMFIPAIVGLMDSWGVLKRIAVPVFVTSVFSTILVMGIGGMVTQKMIRKERRKDHERDIV